MTASPQNAASIPTLLEASIPSWIGRWVARNQAGGGQVPLLADEIEGLLQSTVGILGGRATDVTPAFHRALARGGTRQQLVTELLLIADAAVELLRDHLDVTSETVSSVHRAVGVLVTQAASVDPPRPSTNADDERALLNSVLENSPVAIAFLDEDMRFVRVNEAMARLNGRPVEAHLGRPVSVVLGEGAKLVEPMARKVMSTGVPIVDVELHYGEGPFRRSFLASQYPVRDARGVVRWAGAIVVDVTERVRVERELAVVLERMRADEERARFLAGAGPSVFASLDLRQTLESIAAYVVTHKADLCCVQAFGPDGRVQHTVVRHKDAGKQGTFEEVLRRHTDVATEELEQVRQGHTVTVTRSVANDRGVETGPLLLIPLKARGTVLGMVTVGMDAAKTQDWTVDVTFTLQELAERAALALDHARLYAAAQEANRAKDEFLALVSHELRTPLTAITGWAALMRRRRGDGRVEDRALEIIERSARSQTQLIEDILDVSRIIAGKLHVSSEAVNLSSMARNAVDAVRTVAEARGVTVSVSVEDLPEMMGDWQRLQQVCTNLLGNAVKFTPKGGSVKLALTSEGEEAVLTVEDNGRGIDPAFLPHVFERFRQADSSTTRQSGGLGLGLAIVKHLVEAHGGTVTAESAGLGKGSKFTVRLPLHRLPPPEVTPRTEGESPAVRLDGLSVLIVDDDDDSRDVLREILLEAGASVETASGAAEAISRVEAFHPDVILSDLAMPDVDGFTLLKQVRALLGERKAPPAVAVTAFASDEDAMRSIKGGFAAHVAKPVDAVALTEVVKRLAVQWGTG